MLFYVVLRGTKVLPLTQLTSLACSLVLRISSFTTYVSLSILLFILVYAPCQKFNIDHFCHFHQSGLTIAKKSKSRTNITKRIKTQNKATPNPRSPALGRIWRHLMLLWILCMASAIRNKQLYVTKNNLVVAYCIMILLPRIDCSWCPQLHVLCLFSSPETVSQDSRRVLNSSHWPHS